MTEEEHNEKELRLTALNLAVASSPDGERQEVILARAEAYLAFMKGTSGNG